MRFAMIKNGVVKNVIVASQEFADGQAAHWDHCVRVDEIGIPPKWTKDGEDDVFEDPQDNSWTYVDGIQEPGIGWLYDGTTFTSP